MASMLPPGIEAVSDGVAPEVVAVGDADEIADEPECETDTDEDDAMPVPVLDAEEVDTAEEDVSDSDVVLVVLRVELVEVVSSSWVLVEVGFLEVVVGSAFLVVVSGLLLPSE